MRAFIGRKIDATRHADTARNGWAVATVMAGFRRERVVSEEQQGSTGGPFGATVSPLASCESEPIQFLGAIQPIGFLLAVNADWITTRASENLPEWLGVAAQDIIGTPVSRVIPAAVLHDLRGCIQMAGGGAFTERLFGQRLRPDGPAFAVAVYQAGLEIVLEFEAAQDIPAMAPTVLRSMMARIERQPDFPAVFREVSRQVRGLTGFDRVMVYQFTDDGSGEVVGEAARSGLPPYLGLRYPAEDIPAQARALYCRNLIRIIVDVDAAPVAIIPARSVEGAPLDLSMSVLRSVSPIHLEYLRNMGVAASMSISILQGERLWGLIACHHGSRLHVGLEIRSIGELFGQMLSWHLESRQHAEAAAHAARVREIHDRIVAVFAGAAPSLHDIPDFLAGISGYVACDGIAVYQAGRLAQVGLTPTPQEIGPLLRFLNTTAAGRVYATDHLAAAFPPAMDYLMRAAGLMAVPLSRTPRDYLMFFRRELVRTVTWAGEPVKPELLGPNGARLTPRKSFEAWQETIRHRSAAWTARELQAGDLLRTTLLELVLRVSDAAEAERQVALQRQGLLIAELNHRVRNLLGLVRGLVTQSAGAASDVRALVGSLDDRIRSLARAQDILSNNSHGAVSLHALLRAEIDSFADDPERLELAGPDVELQASAFSAIALVVHELMTNARKYGALKARHGRVSVATSAAADGSVSVAWREIGGPPVLPPARRGFGSTILDHVIPYELSGTSTIRYLTGGICVDLVLPASVAGCLAAPAAGALAMAATRRGGQAEAQADPELLRALLENVLVVEDNLFIALDLEDLLRKLGAANVAVAPSVTAALAELEAPGVSCAILDIHLGAETSLPVAEAMQRRGIPFCFGSGYGEGFELPAPLQPAPLVVKPYDEAALRHALERMLPAAPAAATPLAVA